MDSNKIGFFPTLVTEDGRPGGFFFIIFSYYILIFRLRSLPSDSFRNTKLETLDLSHNEFQVMPNGALADVSESLRYLNLSHNQIQHLDSTMFSNSLKLISLSLAHNRLTILPDNTFMGFSSLLTLDLSHNPIRANFKELFHYTQRLKELRLSHTSLQSVPSLPLPGRILTKIKVKRQENYLQIKIYSVHRYCKNYARCNFMSGL